MRIKRSTNKKIKNATSVIAYGITFKSKFEYNVYTRLKQAGFDVKYEPIKFVLFEGFKPTVPFYDKESIRNKSLSLHTKKVLDITYTPDFVFKYKDYYVIIESKGIENDAFPLKKKMFRKLLESYKDKKIIFFEVYNLINLQQAITTIKQL